MCISSTLTQSDAVLVEYKSRMQRLQSRIPALRARKRWAFSAMLVGTLLMCILVLLMLAGTDPSLVLLAIPWIAMIWGLRTFLRSRGRMTNIANRSSFYERGLDRLEENWRGNGNAGTEYMRDHHLYQRDLDIFGEGSIFELLSTTRTEVGAERLASFLLDPVSVDEARARQEAVKELRDATGLREEIAILGKYRFWNCRAKPLREWLKLSIFKVPSIVPAFLLFSGAVSLSLGLCGYAKIFPWIQIAPVLIPLTVAQAGVALALMSRVRTRIQAMLTLGGDVAVLRQGVEFLAHQQFHCAKLRGVVEDLHIRKATASIRALERLLIAVERREDVLLYAFSLWLAAGTQLVLAVERWRAVFQTDFETWLEAWAEFDALNALACYAWEHPDHTFPDLLDGGALFESENLCHPLLPRECRVGNNVSLNPSTAFYVVSGSNMAGKSTFLRAIGLNAVLAAAGAPLCASRTRTAVFSVCASLAIEDSLVEGKSKFLVEVERLRDSIRALKTSAPVLFLIDEILGGTNSKDRKIAAEALIRTLVTGGAVGALSTHDLALTEIGENPELRGVNVHMVSDNPDEPLAFDYRVKPGVSRQTNALALVRMMGIVV